ncbi:MAG TPA: hypothetical protein VLT87_26635, partial [Thermoanaerobaculia bacterium]|nr:hypothetical protein [Thermoanaerobaculia bacterium]
MFDFHDKKASGALTMSLLTLSLLAGCASTRQPYETRRDKTWKGGAAGAAAGAVGAVLAGKREADEILAGAAIGGAV